MGAGFFQRDVAGQRVVRRDDGAAPLERRLLQQLEILAGLVDAGRHQHGIAAPVGQTPLGREVEHDVGHHPVHARAGTQHLLHGAPLLLQFVALPVVQALGLGRKPLVDLVCRAQPLVDVARFVHQVQHHLVFHRFGELVGVDVATKHLLAGGLVFLEQRGAGEADEHRVGHQRLHHPVQPAALRAVALVHKHKQLAVGGAGGGLHVLDELLKLRLALAARLPAKLVHQRTHQPG